MSPGSQAELEVAFGGQATIKVVRPISARSLPYSTTLCSGGPPLLSRAFCSNYAQNGQLLSPAAAATAPSLSIKGGSEGGLFTVVASDPDPPDPANPI